MASINPIFIMRVIGFSGKEEDKTMDIFMILALAVCFASMKLFTDWCEKQVDNLHIKENEK